MRSMSTDARPGLSSRRFPGAVQELIATGDLPLDTPALVALEQALPDAWFVHQAVGPRLDQQGWPLRNEVELAHRVCGRDPALTERDRAHLATVRAWLHGRIDDDALHAAAQREPVAPSLAELVVQCAYEARTGWLAYHVHRGYASPSAVHAAEVIRRVVRAGGITWPEVVELARSLAPHEDACECEAHRPGVEIFVLSDELGSDWAYDLTLSLDRPGFIAKARDVARFPIGDGLPALLGRLSHAHDVVIVVIAALGGNHAWMIAESRIRNLYPNVLLAMAPGVPLPAGGPRDWIVPAPPSDRMPHAALVARIERLLRDE